jgi:hypothetical protein
MIKKESLSEPSGFLQKEVRRIVFSEIKKEDIPILYNALKKELNDQRKHKLWICIGRHDTWFNNPKEFDSFLHGFNVAMQLVNDDFLDDFGRART